MQPAITGSSMCLADLRALRPGQVIQLDVVESEPIAIRCNEHLLGRGRMKRADDERVLEIEDFHRRPARLRAEAALPTEETG
jgi:flagellar motor switch/type III secretory pathway protein FliN